MRALLDSGAIPNFMNASVASKLSLSPKPTSTKITVANGQKTTCLGSIEGVPVSLKGTVTSLNFLVVEGSPFDILIGYPTLEELQACIDLGHQSVKMVIGNKTSEMSLEFDQVSPIVAGSETDSEEFISDVESFASESSSEEETYVVAILGDDPFELDLTLDGVMKEDDEVDSPNSNVINETMRILREKLAHLDNEAQRIIETALIDKSIVATSLDDLRPTEVPIKHHFELDDTNPIYHSARRMAPLHNKIVRKELDKMLEAGIITPSSSAWSFPVVIVSKKDGNPRFCVDYCTLNQRMKADRWPLPKIEEIFDDLEGTAYFTSLDLFSGYWEIRMAQQCKEMTTFVCRYGTYKFEVMPFGLMNAPSTFQRMMDTIFCGVPFVRVYLDDVVVFSKTLEEHLLHLQQVFDVIDDVGLKLKLSKCSCAQAKIKLLGHVVDKSGIAVDPGKIEVIRNAPTPTTTTERRSFLGLASYYRRFICKFADIAAVLHTATSGNGILEWTGEMQEAFDELRIKLTSPPVLAYSDLEKPFVVETDASSVSVGAVLVQKKEDRKIHPLQYASRTMNTSERNYSACAREALAVIFALKKFRVYLLSSVPFKLVTGHQALSHAFRKKDIHGRLARWLYFLAEYDFTVEYRRGSANSAAHYLSRIDPENGDNSPCQEEVELALAITAPVYSAEDLEASCRDIMSYLQGETPAGLDDHRKSCMKSNAKNFLVWESKLFRRTIHGLRVVVPLCDREKVLKGFCDDIGHWDLKTTRQFVTERYWWPTVYTGVRDYVKSCDGCQKARPIPKYKTTLRHPISSLFDVFSIDFAGPFPATSSGNRFVLVAVEHLTGWPIAIATANSTGQVVLGFVKREILYSFGPPRTIVSDNATCFTASDVSSFMAQHGITWRTFLAYAPMSNGREERMVGTLKAAVRKTVLEMGMEWDKALTQDLYGYRRRTLRNGVSPFELMYGVPPRMDPRAEMGASLVVPSSDVHRCLEIPAGLTCCFSDDSFDVFGDCW